LWTDLGVVDRVRIAATSAIRDADDRDRFLDAVRDITGTDAEVLSGAEEAALAYAGAASATAAPTPAAVVDVGGGSTELIVGGGDGSVAASTSLQLGCVRLTERHFPTDPPTPEQIATAEADVEAQLRRADEELSGAPVGGAACLVAVAGTATTLAALYLGLATYQEDRIHGTRLPRAVLEVLTTRLLGATAAQRARLGPMQPGREDVIHAGALVLRAVVRRTDFNEVVVSEADNLDGLTASMT
jgi:exopolyphosphatase/guanosine-5'-triphosphate,3'-diphosphate pyrophosphatase